MIYSSKVISQVMHVMSVIVLCTAHMCLPALVKFLGLIYQKVGSLMIMWHSFTTASFSFLWAQNVLRLHCHKSVPQPKKLDLVHQTIFPRESIIRTHKLKTVHHLRTCIYVAGLLLLLTSVISKHPMAGLQSTSGTRLTRAEMSMPDTCSSQTKTTSWKED